MFTRREDVIYGRKHGMALTMDVITPQHNANGIALVLAVSGGWFSSHAWIDSLVPVLIEPLVKRGYTVFAVVPSSQPKFTIPEIVQDMHRAVRHIRYHAQQFEIDPHRIGIYGGSAGGHLSLMIGFTGTQGDPLSEDPIERESSRVQAICELYAPTDFLNYGHEGGNAVGEGILADYRAPFEFHSFDPPTKTYKRLTDEHKILETVRQISPITHVGADVPPTLVIHGELDALVPLQQSEILVEKLQQAGVTTRLVVKQDAEHGWEDMTAETTLFADWFDEHLGLSTPVPVGRL